MYTSKGKQRRRLVAWCFLKGCVYRICNGMQWLRSLQIPSFLLAWRPQNISHSIRSSSLTGCLPGNTHSPQLNRPESIFKVRFVKFHLTVTNQPTPWNWVRTTSTSASQKISCILCNPEVYFFAHNSPPLVYPEPHESCPCSPFVLTYLLHGAESFLRS